MTAPLTPGLAARIAAMSPFCVRGNRLHGYGCMYAW